MVTLTLDPTDYSRLNALLGHLASLAYAEIDGMGAIPADTIGTLLTTMPAAEARRLCDELDRQAEKEG